MYQDRIEAGHTLAQLLKKYRDEKGVILAVPRGGVPVAYAVASELKMPLDILLTKKIGHPSNQEYAIGAVSLTDSYIEFPGKVSDEYIKKEIQRLRERLSDMYRKFMGDRQPESIRDKIAIVIDDGIATGNTLMATVNMLRKDQPAKIIIAVPVASMHAVIKLRKYADELICPLIPETFYGVGQFYTNFEQVSDEEVEYYLRKIHEEIERNKAA